MGWHPRIPLIQKRTETTTHFEIQFITDRAALLPLWLSQRLLEGSTKLRPVLTSVLEKRFAGIWRNSPWRSLD